ncbi:MAG: undecaprenyldiphospho-muramoylpentapeptide beta-N-acetylglucosaminyltransferase [Clostridia bacterium]|nr:undecaprenyldiphospho-muramoylpentapeptide beta-N-acetylglucosaminyltransferase [Clostridia bacterium]
MRAIISGGGTAGHIVPGIAIAEEILTRDKTSEILFVGRSGGTENDLVTGHGLGLVTLDASGLERRISFKNAKSALKLLAALRKSRKIIRAFRPDIVIGTGGYVCWPVVRSAIGMGIPTAIHESNATPGLATRMLAKKCDVVFLNFKDCAAQLKRKDNIRVVGNPLLKNLSCITREEARRRLGVGREDFFVLSFGGSGGAALINEQLISVMIIYSVPTPRLKHVHASGIRYFEEIKNKHPDLICGRGGCHITPFIKDMPTYMRAADVVICRSGAMTISELAATGTPSILIPSENVTDNHQHRNADALVRVGAALMLDERSVTAELLVRMIEQLKSNRAEGEKIRRKIVRFCTPNAKKDILDEIEKILSKK